MSLLVLSIFGCGCLTFPTRLNFDLMAIMCRAGNCSKKEKMQIQKRGNDLAQGELILASVSKMRSNRISISLSAVACRKMDGVQSVVHMGFN